MQKRAVFFFLEKKKKLAKTVLDNEKTKQNRKNFNATNRITVFIIYRQRSTDQRVGQITLYLLWSYHFNVPFFILLKTKQMRVVL